MLYETQNPHGGDVYGMELRLDFSSNVNPLGPPPSVISAMQRAPAQLPHTKACRSAAFCAARARRS